MAATVGGPKPDETLRSRQCGQLNSQTDRCHAETRRGHGIPSANGRSPAYAVLYEGEAYVKAALGRIMRACKHITGSTTPPISFTTTGISSPDRIDVLCTRQRRQVWRV